MNKQKLSIWLLAAAVPLIALAPLPDFWIAQLNYIGLYAIVSLGLVLLTGVAGLTSFGQAAFVGVALQRARALHVLCRRVITRHRPAPVACVFFSASAAP